MAEASYVTFPSLTASILGDLGFWNTLFQDQCDGADLGCTVLSDLLKDVV